MISAMYHDNTSFCKAFEYHFKENRCITSVHVQKVLYIKKLYNTYKNIQGQYHGSAIRYKK